MNVYEWLGQPGGIIGPAIGSTADYTTPGRLGLGDYQHVLRVAFTNLQYASDPTARRQLVEKLKAAGGLLPGDDVGYWADPARTPAEIEHLIAEAAPRLAAIPPTATTDVSAPPGPQPGIVDPNKGVTDVAPVQVGATKIPQGGRVVIVNNPEGSDESQLYHIVYAWRGNEFAFEVGGQARFNELFGGITAFAQVNTVSQAAFDQTGFVKAGLIDSEIGATESFGSKLEREVRELGLEDLPSWLGNSPDALSIVAIATAEEWSSGRLWEKLATTQAFQGRFGTAWSRYFTEGRSIAEAVNALVADENQLRAAIQPWLTTASNADTTVYLQQLLNQGWTGGAVAQVLEQAEVLRRKPESLLLANTILSRSGLATLDEVGFINALNGVGPQDTIEALNTATAARALDEAGIDLDDETINLVMELVDTSDRLLTADRWSQLAQELSFNLIRFNTELDQGKLGALEPDLIAAAFGRESPSGKSSGEVINLLARFERDRRVASQGTPGSTGFTDDQGRLRIQGLGGL